MIHNVKVNDPKDLLSHCLHVVVATSFPPKGSALCSIRMISSYIFLLVIYSSPVTSIHGYMLKSTFSKYILKKVFQFLVFFVIMFCGPFLNACG